MENKNTRLYLVRHAESESNSSGTYTGWGDVDLSEKGVMQAKMGANFFKGIDVENVYASTLKRAYRSAELIFGENRQVKKMDEFKELNVGLFETRTHGQLLEIYPELYRNWVNDPTTTTPPEGESIQEYHARVTDGLNDVLAENIGKSAVIVSHGGVIRSFVVHTLNMNLKDIWRIKVDNMSVTIVEYMGSRKSLMKLNETCHLKEGVA